MHLEKLIEVARGEQPADLVLRNGRVINVFSHEVEAADIAVSGTRIAAVGQGYQGRQVVDLGGRHVCPGFIDGHMHVESSMISPREFTRAVVPLGTTAIVMDPHEIANVLGLEGVRYMMDSCKHLPMSAFIMLPSLVPVTHLETSGARLLAEDMAPLLNEKWVLGVAEIAHVNVLNRDPVTLDKIRLAGSKRVDGHAPAVYGRDLCAVSAAGLASDHESTRLEEAREKLRRGMYVMIRQGSVARNLDDLLPLVTPENARHVLLVSDDRHPAGLLEEGHMNYIVKGAIEWGLDPITAIQLATLNPAEYFGLRELGAIAPGRRADMVVFDDFDRFCIEQVYRGGRLVAENGRFIPPPQELPPLQVRRTINVHRLRSADFQIPAQASVAKLIGIIPNQIVTRKRVEEISIREGRVVPDPDRDILPLMVIERHFASGNVGKGLVQGLGLKQGAIALSVAHDSHNLIVAGTNEADMLSAVVQVIRMQGGMSAVADGQVVGSLALPIAGLMSEASLEEVKRQLDQLLLATARLGSTLDNPFMALSFLSLAVIPELKLTDQGLVDVQRFELVSLFGEN